MRCSAPDPRSLASEQPGLPFTTGGLSDVIASPVLSSQVADVESACGRSESARARWDSSRVHSRRWCTVDVGACRCRGATARSAKDRRRTRTARKSAGKCDRDARVRWHQQSGLIDTRVACCSQRWAGRASRRSPCGECSRIPIADCRTSSRAPRWGVWGKCRQADYESGIAEHDAFTEGHWRSLSNCTGRRQNAKKRRSEDPKLFVRVRRHALRASGS